MTIDSIKFHKKNRYLQNMNNGRILIYTDRLAKRKDMREFIPEFDKEGNFIKPKATAEMLDELEAKNIALEKENAQLKREKEENGFTGTESIDEEALGSYADIDEPGAETPEEGEGEAPEEEIVLDELEEELEAPSGKVTRKFLLKKDADELRDYCFRVYGVKQNKLKKVETLVEDILKLQKQMDI